MNKNNEKSFLEKHGNKLPALLFWVGLVVAYYLYANANDLSPLEVTQEMLGFMQNGIWGVLIFILLYAIRPLILFPATFITVAAGFVFGPVLGVIYTIIASNISSTIAFYV